MAKVELFVKTEPTERRLAPEEEILFAEVEQAMALAEQAGLPGVAKRHHDRLTTPSFIPGGNEVSAEDYGIWRQWLPTTYRTDARPYDGRRGWQEYAYDQIPTSVLEIIADLKPKLGRAEGFDALEIRTPERARVNDPALFGIKGEGRWLLARWGESDERLVSFEEIRAGVQALAKVDALEHSPAGAICILGTPLAVGAVVLAVIVYQSAAGLPKSAADEIINIAIPSAAFLFGGWSAIRWQRIRRELSALRTRFAYALSR